MKLLPCPRCGPKGAALPKTGTYPDHEPHTSAGHVPEYVCARCKTRSKLSKPQWNALPHLNLEDFNRLAKDYKAPQFADLPIKELVGAGFKKEHAQDLFRAGLADVAATEALSRG